MAKKKKEKVVITTNDEFKKLTQIIIGVLLIFILFFTITYLLTKKKNDDNKPVDQETKIQYDEILVGEILNQNESEYYVLVLKEKDHFVGLYETYLSEYKKKEKAIRIFYSNLDSVFSKKYEAEESKLSVTNIKDIRFTGTTLLKIKDKKIVNYYETKDKIVEHLETLSE